MTTDEFVLYTKGFKVINLKRFRNKTNAFYMLKHLKGQLK